MKSRSKEIRTESNSERSKNKFPGYPHYSQEEDFLVSPAERMELDMEKFPVRVPVEKPEEQTDNQGNAVEIVSGTEADVNAEDLAALGPEELNMDMGDDEQLKNAGERFDRTAEELDIPGTELDDENESIGSEDEENNYYSLGGDKHDNP